MSETKRPYEGGYVHKICKMINIDDNEFARIAERIPPWPEGSDAIWHALQTCAKCDNLLLFFGDDMVLQYKGRFSTANSPLRDPGSREKIKGKNEIVDPSASLNEQNLRHIFVSIEALVFKLVHIKLEGLSATYTGRTEHYDRRVKRLGSGGVLDADQQRQAMDLYRTRCEFAHSIKRIEDISYLSKPLMDRWGSKNSTRHNGLKRKFLPDAFKFTEVLLSEFKPMQVRQLDAEKLRSILRGL